MSVTGYLQLDDKTVRVTVGPTAAVAHTLEASIGVRAFTVGVSESARVEGQLTSKQVAALAPQYPTGEHPPWRAARECGIGLGRARQLGLGDSRIRRYVA